MTHQLSKSVEYGVWKSIVQRCEDPSHTSYQGIGGKGIRVCERWRNSFISFYNDMGNKPSKKHMLIRKDKTKGFTHENCEWNLSLKSTGLNIREEAAKLGICPGSLYSRLKKFPLDQALQQTPGRKYTKGANIKAVKQAKRKLIYDKLKLEFEKV